MRAGKSTRADGPLIAVLSHYISPHPIPMLTPLEIAGKLAVERGVFVRELILAGYPSSLLTALCQGIRTQGIRTKLSQACSRDTASWHSPESHAHGSTSSPSRWQRQPAADPPSSGPREVRLMRRGNERGTLPLPCEAVEIEVERDGLFHDDLR